MACGQYVQTYVKPYIKLNGIIEMDECKLTNKFVFHTNTSKKVLWCFGLYDRKSKVPILYFMEDKKGVDLLPLMKKHILPGSCLMSDSASQYVHMAKAKSKLN